MASNPTVIKFDVGEVQDEPKPVAKFDVGPAQEKPLVPVEKFQIDNPRPIKFDLPRRQPGVTVQKAPTPRPVPELTPEAGRVEPMSVGGFVENVLDQAWEMGKGLVTGTTEGWKKILSTPAETWGEILKNPGAITEGTWDVAKRIGSVTFGSESDYAKHGVRVLYDKPLTPILDAMTLLSLGGAGATRLGVAAKSQKLIDIGAKMTEMPAKLGRKLFELPARAIGVSPESLTFLRKSEGKHKAIGETLKAELKAELDPVLKKMPESDKILLDKVLQEGATVEEFAALPANVKATIQTYDNFLEYREGRLIKRGFRNRQELDDVVAKKYAARKWSNIDDAHVAQAKAEIKALGDAGGRKPVYTPAVFNNELTIEDLFDDLLFPTNVSKGKGGPSFLKPYKGGRGNSDPTVYITNSIDRFVEMESRLSFMDELMREGYIRPARSGDVALSHIMPDGIGKKYIDFENRVKSLGVKGLRGEKGVDAAMDAIFEGDALKKYIAPLKELAAKDATTASFLKWTFYQPSGPWRPLLRTYDKILNGLKQSFTVYNPKWVTGNVVGDAVLSVMAGHLGLEWRQVKKILASLPPNLRPRVKSISRELADGPLSTRISDFMGSLAQSADDFARNGIWTREVSRQLKAAGLKGAVSQDALIAALREVGESPGLISKLYNELQNLDEDVARAFPGISQHKAIVDKIASSGKPMTSAQRGQFVRSHTELLKARSYVRDRMTRAADIEKRIPGIQRLQEISDQALQRANDFLGDYLGLGPIERGVFRRIVPFYPWAKAMTQLAFKLPFIAPKMTFLWNRYAQAMMTMVDDPDLPDWLRGYIPAYIRENGDIAWVRLSGIMPFANMASSRFGDTKIPKLLAFWEANPFISVGMKMAGARNEFFWAGSVPTDEPVVSIGDGTIARFLPNGKIETVVPQDTLIHQLMGLFPVVQLMRQAVSEYDINKGPLMNPDGTYQYPVELWQRLLAMAGPKSMVKSPEKLKMMERRWTMNRIRDLKKQIRSASPERRQQILEILQDRSKGYYRKRESNF